MVAIKDIKQFFTPSIPKIIITIALLLVLEITAPPWVFYPFRLFYYDLAVPLKGTTNPLMNVLKVALENLIIILYMYFLTCCIMFVFNFIKNRVIK